MTNLTVAGSYEARLSAHYAEVRRRLRGRAAFPTNIIKEVKRRKEAEALAEATAEAIDRRTRLMAGLRASGAARPTLTDGQMNAIFTILDAYDVTWQEVISPSREQRLVGPRSLIAVLFRQFGWALPRIGLIMRRDHTSIYAACKKFGPGAWDNPNFLRALNCV